MRPPQHESFLCSKRHWTNKQTTIRNTAYIEPVVKYIGNTPHITTPTSNQHSDMAKEGRRPVARQHLQTLEKMSLEELFEIQKDVNTLLEKRFKEFKLEFKHKMNEIKESKNHNDNDLLPSTLKKPFKIPATAEKLNAQPHPKHTREMVIDIVDNSEGSCMEDTQEFIFTQLEHPTTNSQTSEQNTQYTRVPPQRDVLPKDSQEIILTQENSDIKEENSYVVYSSPLKASQESAESQDVIGIPLLEKNTNILSQKKPDDWTGKKVRPRNDSCNNNPRESKFTKFTQGNKGSSLRSIHVSEPNVANEKLNLNTNPFTSKPWIMEDFKPNQDVASVRRGQKKLEQFHRKVGTPMGYDEAHKEVKVGSAAADDFIFDNLVGRTDSPPGYGRLDFPTTQERMTDKLESKRIIRQKTINRFLSAANNLIPPQEREFLFKREALNEAIDNDDFDWERTLLQVYPPPE